MCVCVFGFNWILRPRFTFFKIFFFSCTWTVTSYGLLAGTKITVHTLFITVYNTVHALKNIKMGPTVLFTHLKIILLQYFQFSISATISSIQMDHIYIYIYIFFFFLFLKNILYNFLMLLKIISVITMIKRGMGRLLNLLITSTLSSSSRAVEYCVFPVWCSLCHAL